MEALTDVDVSFCAMCDEGCAPRPTHTPLELPAANGASGTGVSPLEQGECQQTQTLGQQSENDDTSSQSAHATAPRHSMLLLKETAPLGGITATSTVCDINNNNSNRKPGSATAASTSSNRRKRSLLRLIAKLITSRQGRDSLLASMQFGCTALLFLLNPYSPLRKRLPVSANWLLAAFYSRRHQKYIVWLLRALRLKIVLSQVKAVVRHLKTARRLLKVGKGVIEFRKLLALVVYGDRFPLHPALPPTPSKLPAPLTHARPRPRVTPSLLAAVSATPASGDAVQRSLLASPSACRSPPPPPPPPSSLLYSQDSLASWVSQHHTAAECDEAQYALLPPDSGAGTGAGAGIASESRPSSLASHSRTSMDSVAKKLHARKPLDGAGPLATTAKPLRALIRRVFLAWKRIGAMDFLTVSKRLQVVSCLFMISSTLVDDAAFLSRLGVLAPGLATLLKPFSKPLVVGLLCSGALSALVDFLRVSALQITQPSAPRPSPSHQPPPLRPRSSAAPGQSTERRDPGKHAVLRASSTHAQTWLRERLTYRRKMVLLLLCKQLVDLCRTLQQRSSKYGSRKGVLAVRGASRNPITLPATMVSALLSFLVSYYARERGGAHAEGGMTGVA